MKNSTTGHTTVTIIVFIKKLSFNSFGGQLPSLRVIDRDTTNNLRNLCTNFLHVSLKFLFIKTKLENLNFSTHIVIGNTLLIKTQTSLIRVHVSTEKGIL